MSDERRRYRRYAARDLRGTYEGDGPFEVVTIGLGGMLVKLPDEASLDDLVRVELDLGSESFAGEGRVVFVGPDTTSSRNEGYRVGLAFEDPPPGEQLRLERYIRREYE